MLGSSGRSAMAICPQCGAPVESGAVTCSEGCPYPTGASRPAAIAVAVAEGLAEVAAASGPPNADSTEGAGRAMGGAPATAPRAMTSAAQGHHSAAAAVGEDGETAPSDGALDGGERHAPAGTWSGVEGERPSKPPPAVALTVHVGGRGRTPPSQESGDFDGHTEGALARLPREHGNPADTTSERLRLEPVVPSRGQHPRTQHRGAEVVALRPELNAAPLRGTMVADVRQAEPSAAAAAPDRAGHGAAANPSGSAEAAPKSGAGGDHEKGGPRLSSPDLAAGSMTEDGPQTGRIRKVVPPPILASTLLADQGNSTRGASRLSRYVALVGAGFGAMTTLLVGGLSWSAILLVIVFLASGAIAVGRFADRTRTKALAIDAILGLAIASVAYGMAAGWAGVVLVLGAAALLTGLIHRSLSRGSSAARVTVAIGITTIFGWFLAHGRLSQLTVLDLSWQSWMPAALTVALIVLVLFAFLAFMDGVSRGGCHVWAALLVAWMIAFYVTEVAVGVGAGGEWLPARDGAAAAARMAVPWLTTILAVAVATLMHDRDRHAERS